VRLEFRHGRIVKIAAFDNLEAVEAALASDSARRFREFAVGLNPNLPGLAYFGYGSRTVRLSLGDNEELGGTVRGDFRRWFFFTDASVEVESNRRGRTSRRMESK